MSKNTQLDGLSVEARKKYDIIRRQWAVKDEPGLTLLLTAMQALDRLRQAQKILADEGILIEDRFKQMKPHPASQIEKEARAGMILALKALDLDLETLDVGEER